MNLSLRRIVGLLGGALTLCLTTGVLDVPCASSQREDSSATAMATAHHAAQPHGLPMKTDGKSTPCKSIPTSCCAAMTSCMTLAVAEQSTATQNVPRNDAIEPLRLGRALSRIAAPETPPPKA